jgi:hypothetical protein
MLRMDYTKQFQPHDTDYRENALDKLDSSLLAVLLNRRFLLRCACRRRTQHLDVRKALQHGQKASARYVGGQRQSAEVDFTCVDKRSMLNYALQNSISNRHSEPAQAQHVNARRAAISHEQLHSAEIVQTFRVLNLEAVDVIVGSQTDRIL